jgi:hypothetical protein
MFKKFTEEQLNKFGKSSKAKGLATASTEDLIKELLERERTPILFPLDVFPSELYPLINALHDKLCIEKSYIGTTLLALSGAAIGNSLKGGIAAHLPTCTHGWYCLLGESSSGKTFVQKQLMTPMFKIDDDFKSEFQNQVREAENDKKQTWEIAQKALIVQNITFEAFIRDKLRHNPKGLLKWYDELTEWVDNMSQYQKGKNSPFVTYMLQSWSNASYTMDRSGNKNVHIASFQSGVSVLGGTQPGLVHTFFANGLFERGYTNRMVFALPEQGLGRMLVPNPFYVMDEQLRAPWDRAINRMFFELPYRKGQDPVKAKFEQAGVHQIYSWQLKQMEEANATEDLIVTRSVIGNYIGKINEYVARWAMILAMLERALSSDHMETTLVVREHHAESAIRIAEYYIATFREVYKLTLQARNVPADVAQFVFLVKQGEALSDISRKLKLCTKRDASRQAHSMAAKRKAIEIIANYPGLLKADEIFTKSE